MRTDWNGLGAAGIVLESATSLPNDGVVVARIEITEQGNVAVELCSAYSRGRMVGFVIVTRRRLLMG
jgi:hypothetical protein